MTSRRHGLLLALAGIAIVVLLLCALPATASAARGDFGWPVSPTPQVVRGFDNPTQRWQSGHRGVDLAVAPGTPVRAAGTGTVQFAGQVAGRGLVSIRHADGLITTYEPVQASVRQGQSVSRGEFIGTVIAGHPGCPASACLHWGARRGRGHDAAYLDPRALLGAIRVRLKPLRPADVPVGAPRAAVPR
ncbi:M23 family metallopeptidase [Gordonia sp. CPCC 205515]|uniref:M23 family metallopeptidase n=1 Tax=Gordonia sp. CPCC 205515 TaxID=3140791 RepID=UPI003AF37993